MNYLIFRVDRIGDFLIILSLINSIKRNKPNAKINIVCSKHNIDFIKKIQIINKVYILDRKSFISKLKLITELRKFSYESIITSDKKNSSIFISLFLKSKKKIFNVSKYFQYRILKIFYKDVFIDNDNISKNINEILKENSRCLDCQLDTKDNFFFRENYFKEYYNHQKILDLDNLNYAIFHYDEKWENLKYQRVFKKADLLTDITPNTTELKNFLNQLSDKHEETIIVTTGKIETENINHIKKVSNKISDNIYEIELDKNKAYLITNESFYSTSHLISRSKKFISCHGAFTHIAANYNVKIIDIIEANKKQHYRRITNQINNYNYIFRDKFSTLSKDILNNL